MPKGRGITVHLLIPAKKLLRKGRLLFGLAKGARALGEPNCGLPDTEKGNLPA